MAIVLNGVTVPLGDEDIKAAAANKLGISVPQIALARVKRQSVDCRRKDIHCVYTLHVTLLDEKLQRAMEERFGRAEQYREPEIEYGEKSAGRPIVVGAGPCGLFAALTLAEHGYKPIVIERGKSAGERESDVGRLFDKGELDPESNVCFGAGGAGAFSDGKLVTRIKDARAERVLEILAQCGAPDEILTQAKPHTGTENIRKAVEGLIERIKSLGGEVEYSARLTAISVSRGELCGITYIKEALPRQIDAGAAVLATGHSARDTYAMLLSGGTVILPKPFAVGVRIEHKREFIDRSQYGEAYGHPALGAAEYRMSAKSGGRGVYTFCMCPGGEVICSATEEGGVAVNGMSYFSRGAENSNSAVVVSVGPEDFGHETLAGVEFQRRLERAAYAEGYGTPVQTFADFIAGNASQRFGSVTPSYRPYTHFMDLNECLPGYVAAALKEGITRFGRQIKGFDMPDAVLTGVETRTSSPVRILRGANLQAQGIAGLYPAGEGAGYAGGIVSAAVDGMRCAEALMSAYRRP